MNTLDILINRRSSTKLTDPSPNDKEIELILKAGSNVPDHGNIKPWRFIIIKNDGIFRLSNLFEEAAIQCNLDEKEIKSAKNAPFRAPLIISTIACPNMQSNIPYWEQISSAACTMYAMQLAAISQGFNGIWRTGFFVESSIVRSAFSCLENDKIMGFLYLGTPKIKENLFSYNFSIDSFIKIF